MAPTIDSNTDEFNMSDETNTKQLEYPLEQSAPAVKAKWKQPRRRRCRDGHAPKQVLVFSCLALHCLVLSCRVLACLLLPCLLLFSLLLSCLALSCRVLSCVLLSYLVFCCLVLSLFCFGKWLENR
jgi:hypothetical protein